MTTPTYYWKWNDGSGTTVVDSGGLGADFSITTVGDGTWGTAGAGGYWQNGAANSRAELATPAPMDAFWGGTTWAMEIVLTTCTTTIDVEVLIHPNGGWQLRFPSAGVMQTLWAFGGSTITTGSVWSNATKYHMVWVWDTTQSTASERVRIYLNGVRQSVSGTQPTLNETMGTGTPTYFMASNGGGQPLLAGSRMHWSALFGTIPTDAEWATRSAALLADDDANPSDTPAAVRSNSFFSLGGF